MVIDYGEGFEPSGKHNKRYLVWPDDVWDLLARIDMYRGRTGDDRFNGKWGIILDRLPRFQAIMQFIMRKNPVGNVVARGNIIESIVGIAYAIASGGHGLVHLVGSAAPTGEWALATGRRAVGTRAAGGRYRFRQR